MLAWSWGGEGGRPRGHSAVLIKDDDGVWLWDPHTGRHRYDPESGRFEGYEAQDLVGKIVVGYLDADGVAVSRLRDPDAQLADADEIGYVQGLPGDGEGDSGDHEAEPGGPIGSGTGQSQNPDWPSDVEPAPAAAPEPIRGQRKATDSPPTTVTPHTKLNRRRSTPSTMM